MRLIFFKIHNINIELNMDTMPPCIINLCQRLAIPWALSTLLTTNFQAMSQIVQELGSAPWYKTRLAKTLDEVLWKK